MNETLLWPACILAAYLIGSVPFGLLIGLARGVDIREHGSKNIGATNTGRVLGRRWGVLCFVLDVLKGTLPVIGAGALTGALGASDRGALTGSEAWLWLGVAAGAVMGHMHSVFLRFKGGKGVATGFGALLGVWPALTGPALAALIVWMVVISRTRIVSVSSIVAAVSLPLTTLAVASARGTESGAATAFVLVTAFLGGFVIWKHRANIARLRAGTEPRIAPRKAR